MQIFSAWTDVQFVKNDLRILRRARPLIERDLHLLLPRIRPSVEPCVEKILWLRRALFTVLASPER